MIATRRQSLITPSYAQGYTRGAGEAANPGLWDGLVGAWMPSLGASGGTLFDVSGRGNHGTLTNMNPATDWALGANGMALNFTNNKSRINVISPVLDQNVGTCILSYIRRGTADPFSGFFNIENSSNDSTHELTLGSSTSIGLRFSPNQDEDSGRYWLFVPGTNTAINLLTLGRQYVFAVTWNNPQGRIVGYIDGNVSGSDVGSGSWTASPWVQNEILSIGSNYYDTLNLQCVGDIDRFITYNRALSPQEIQHLYADPMALVRRKARVYGFSPGNNVP